MRASRRFALVTGACLLLLALVLQPAACRQITQLFGPPAAGLEETYAGDQGGDRVDHSALDKVMATHVGADGLVDYAALRADRGQLDAYLLVLRKVRFAALGRDEKLVLLINAYNAFTLALILDHWPLESIRDIPSPARWSARRWRIGELELSLDDIEHVYLRDRFREPRIHFAINCASIGCPPLRPEAYSVDRIEAQLQEQATRIHADKRWFNLDARRRRLRLTKLYQWFGADFAQVAGSELEFAARFHAGLARLLEGSQKPDVEWLDYDWRLNIRR